MPKRKKSIFDHMALKILALLISFMLWFVVTNISDNTITKAISDIPVEILNEDVIAGDNNVFDITSGETVDIVVKGPRSIVEGMDSSSFVATADLSKLSVVNSTSIDVQTSSQISLADSKKLTITKVNSYVTLSIEEAVEKSIPVKVITTGNVLSGRALGVATPTPNIITVTGPASVLANVVEARAVVDVSGASSFIDTTVRVGCTDGYGAAVVKDNIKMQVSEVNVSIPVYNTKTVPVNVNADGTPADGYAVRTVNYNPTKVLICGEQEKLNDISSIDIDNISVASATENIEKNVYLEDYLPEGIFVADESQTEIAISIEIEKMVEKEINLAKNSITILDKSTKYDYEVKAQELIKIKLYGFQEHIADITLDALYPRVSVADLEPGSHELSLTFNESETFVVNGTYSVTVEVKEKHE